MAALVLTYAFALWLGTYLLVRNWSSPPLRWTGLGLLVYALALALQLLGSLAAEETLRRALLIWGQASLFGPALLWTGALIELVPPAAPGRDRLMKIWLFGQIPLAAVLFLVGTRLSKDLFQPGSGVYLAFALVVLLPLLGAAALLLATARAAGPRGPVGMILTATLFFALGSGALLFPLGWIPPAWLVPGIGADLFLLGIAIGLLDAFQQGETWRPDFLRSLVYVAFTMLAFAGPVTLTMALVPGPNFELTVLLLITLLVATLTPVLADPIQSVLDRIAFRAAPGLLQERASLRAAASALPRINRDLELLTLPEDEFVRLTRQALSHYGNLPRLAASPLSRLPAITSRLAERRLADNTLNRASELKSLLAESIAHLKPPGESAFGQTDEWRFYNALFFPYVQGLKPYRRRVAWRDLDATSVQALEWFRAQVPERTLYNWQSAAAALVARYLRELPLPDNPPGASRTAETSLSGEQ